jgi:hypothetical protein
MEFDLLGMNEWETAKMEPRGKKDRDEIGFFCLSKRRKKEREMELVSFFSIELSKSRWN